MPEPQADPNLAAVRRTALYALIAGAALVLLKFLIFAITNSVAVLGDGLESLINVAAAGFMLYTIWYSNRPADREHPYGHGKIEFMAVGLEGWLILIAGVVIAFEAVRRLFVGVELTHLGAGLWLLGIVALLDAALAGYVWRAGRKYDNAVLDADAKHLFADVASTFAVFLGLGLVRWTDQHWLDPIVAVIVAAVILTVSWRLLWHSFHGLMDRSDPGDQSAIRRILDDEVAQGRIRGYHKVRHRHTGAFRWVDMHLHLDGELTIAEGHEIASAIEGRIERELGRTNATAHLEPYDPQRHPPAGLSAADVAASEQRARTQSDAPEPPPSEDADMSESPPSAKPAHNTSSSTEPPAPPPTFPADRPELADERDPDADEDSGPARPQP